MRPRDFHFDLPQQLIAQAPPARRDAARLLCLPAGASKPRDCGFRQLPELLAPGDVLVINDTRVIPARLYGRKRSGGKVEVLVERLLDSRRCIVQVRGAKSLKVGAEIVLEGDNAVTVTARYGDMFELRAAGARDLPSMLDAVGHIPLPPYIKRQDTAADRARYQTVYATRPGAVAAPTAGLHFDRAMLARLAGRGVHIARITLHVGAGTFQPVRAERIEDHRLHKEWLEVGQEAAAQVNAAKAAGRRVVAVGTTSVRALEAAARQGGAGGVEKTTGDTNLFIYPGYKFKVVDALLTNFHLPESTLLMLVAALGGRERVLAAYRHAVEQRYRFFSYGDAMWVAPL